MALEIIHILKPPRIVTVGHADRVIEPPKVVEPPPAVEPEKKRGRPKKMAKDFDEVGTKTIRKDDAGEQGAIGSHGENAPAQEKMSPSKPQESEQGKEE